MVVSTCENCGVNCSWLLCVRECLVECAAVWPLFLPHLHTSTHHEVMPWSSQSASQLSCLSPVNCTCWHLVCVYASCGCSWWWCGHQSQGKFCLIDTLSSWLNISNLFYCLKVSSFWFSVITYLPKFWEGSSGLRVKILRFSTIVWLCLGNDRPLCYREIGYCRSHTWSVKPCLTDNLELSLKISSSIGNLLKAKV